MKSLLKLLGTLLIGICLFNTVNGQTTKADKKAAKAAEINRIIRSANYVFTATYAVPQRGGSRSISDYELTVNKNKLNVYLPYFGRSYVAPMDPNDGGIKLITTNFDYKAQQNKKGSWDIMITPRDKNSSGSKDVRTLKLSVGDEGYATLQVTSYNREGISFNGSVSELKKDSKQDN